MVGTEARAVRLLARSRRSLDGVFLAFAFLVPFMPRPTVPGVERWVAVVAVAVLMATLAVWGVLSLSPPRAVRLHRLVAILVLVLLAYGGRIAVDLDTSEFSHFVSRLMFSGGLVALVLWASISGNEVRKALGGIAFGFLLLSVLIVLVGFTGLDILDPPRPPRFLPFYKNAGVPRSFGEVGVIASVCWAYLLVFRREFSRTWWHVLVLLLMAAVVITQSRNVYLGVVAVTVAAILTRKARGARLKQSLIVLAAAGPYLVQALLVPLRSFPITSIFLEAGTELNNVEVRIELNRLAGELLASRPLASIAGIGHADWVEAAVGAVGKAEVVHNHFLSNIMFLGFLGGGVLLVYIYALPAFRICHRSFVDHNVRLVYLSVVGATVNLSFYEGFFSPVLMIILAMLWVLAYPEEEDEFTGLVDSNSRGALASRRGPRFF